MGAAKEPKAGPAKQKPMMRQYAEAKAAYPDAILFFRLGDFYEMFFEDAVVASGILGITLTSRNRGSPEEEPMAGVPHHAAHGYVARLLAAGHKVAICEQLADPSKVKGIVPRAVVRVVTPGLVTDDGQLDARQNHFLCAIEAGESAPGAECGFGVALLDLSTGDLLAARVDGTAAVMAELAAASPHELLLGPGAEHLSRAAVLALPGVTVRVEANTATEVDGRLARVLGADAARDAQKQHTPLARAAAARVLEFATSCTPRQELPVRRLAVLASAHAMSVDETAQAHLELVRGADGSSKGTLLETIDRTVTPAGARLLRGRLLAPLTDVAAIRARLDEVEIFVLHPRTRTELRDALATVGDLTRIAVKVALGEAGPRELGRLRDGLAAAPRAAAAVEKLPASERSLARLEDVDPVAELGALLARSIVDRPPTEKDGGFVREGFDAALDAARKVEREGTELIVALEQKLRAATGANGLKVRYTRVFGWYIEVTRSHLAKVPATWQRKQTVAGAERFTTPELAELAAEIETASDRARARESAILEDLLSEARRAEARVRALAARLAEWDVASALAEVAHQNDYARPTLDDGDVIDIELGRHPVVERHVQGKRFVPNDTRLDRSAGRLWLVTGPNMAGKSTLMRQVALITLLAQMGSFVPAKRARIGIVDRLFSRVGASDNLARGQSTFMVEMSETAAILRGATPRSLVILDEIGRGTSTYDGLAIAWATAEHLHDVIGCRAMFATHYHELTQLAESAPHLLNVSVSAREHDGDVVFLHTLEHGPASRSYGIAVAKLAGLPESVLARARALCASFEEGRERAPVATPTHEGSQLGLFDHRASGTAEREAVETLRAAEVDRMTPLDALALVAKLKARL